MAVLRTRKKVLLFIVAMLIVLIGTVITSVVVYASSYYTIRVNYYFPNGAHAHDPYIATFLKEENVDTEITNPNINGYVPMVLNDANGDPTALPTGGTEKQKIQIQSNANHTDVTYDV